MQGKGGDAADCGRGSSGRAIVGFPCPLSSWLVFSRSGIKWMSFRVMSSTWRSTETHVSWPSRRPGFKEQDPQSELEIDGVRVPFRLFRDPAVTGKSLGRGVCLYVNKNWCKTVIVRETLCTKDIELLSVSLRPFYLPREFTQLFITVVYVHPKANADVATQAMLKTVQRLQGLAPDAPHFIMGDFNNCKPSKSLCNFYQYVTCPARHAKYLDLCFGSVTGAYKSLSRAPLGMSDHNMVYLVPSDKSVLKRNKPERRSVPVWSEESTHCLQDCFHNTDWDLFINVCEDIDELTDVVSSYVSFCEASIIPRKEIFIYPNNKPWVSKSVKTVIDQKNICFSQGDTVQFKELQKHLQKEIKLAKCRYKDKIESMLKEGSSRPDDADAIQEESCLS